MRSLNVGSGPWICSASASERDAMRGLAVEGSALLRVLAVGQVALLAQDDAELLGEARAADVVEVGRDLALVGGHGREGLGREALADLGRDGSVLADLLHQQRVVVPGHRRRPRRRSCGPRHRAARVRRRRSSRPPRRWPRRAGPTWGAKGRMLTTTMSMAPMPCSAEARQCPRARGGGPGCRRRSGGDRS